MANDNSGGAVSSKLVNFRIGLVLVIGCVIGAAAIVPYQLHLVAAARVELAGAPPVPLLLTFIMFQAVIMFGLATAIGLWLRPRTRLPLPWLEAHAKGEPLPSLAPLAMAAAIGLATGLVIRALDATFYPGLADVVQPPLWTRMLASLYGGFNEEVLLRFCVMSVIAAGLTIVLRQPHPNAAIRWISIFLAALLFAAGHLFVTQAITALTPDVVARALILNGIGGAVFGWLAWKRGLEAAIVAHFTADIALHVLAS